MKLRKVWPFIVVLAAVAAAAVFLIVPRENGTTTGTGTEAATGASGAAQLDPVQQTLLDLVTEAVKKKYPPRPGIRVSGSWLDQIVAHEEKNPGAIRRFILSGDVEISAKDIALQAYMRYIIPRPQLAKDVLETAEAILDYETSDKRFTQFRMTAVGLITRCARLRKANPEIYRRSLDMLIERFNTERDIQVLHAVIKSFTHYSEPELIIPKLLARFDSLDLSDGYNEQPACQIVRAIGSIRGKMSDEFIGKTAREHPLPSVRITAVEVFSNKTAKFAVPFLEELLEIEEDPRVIKRIEDILAIKKRKSSPKR